MTKEEMKQVKHLENQIEVLKLEVMGLEGVVNAMEYCINSTCTFCGDKGIKPIYCACPSCSEIYKHKLKSLDISVNRINNMENEDKTTGEVNKRMMGVPLKEHTDYPSRYKIGEGVFLKFGDKDIIKWCFIDAVHFTESKVRYDILVPLNFEHLKSEETMYTTIKDVDSICVIDEFKMPLEASQDKTAEVN